MDCELQKKPEKQFLRPWLSVPGNPLSKISLSCSGDDLFVCLHAGCAVDDADAGHPGIETRYLQAVAVKTVQIGENDVRSGGICESKRG